jgi:two-component system, NarL family, response regulator LiaR
MISNTRPLTASEIAVMKLLAKGLMYKEVAIALGLNINTVKKHCKNIYKKLQVRNRTEASIKFTIIKAA